MNEELRSISTDPLESEDEAYYRSYETNRQRNQRMGLQRLPTVDDVYKEPIPNVDLIPTFAFGANMCYHSLENRGVAVDHSKRAIVKGYKMVFSVLQWDGSDIGFGSLEEDSEEVVHGIVHWVAPEAIRTLDKREGPQYDRRYVTCVLKDGSEIEAMAYLQTQAYDGYPYGHDIVPHRRYMQIIIDAAIACELDEEWIEYLENMELRDYRPVEFTDEQLEAMRSKEFLLDDIKSSKEMHGTRVCSGLMVLDGVVIQFDHVRADQVYSLWFLGRDITFDMIKMVSYDPVPEERIDASEEQNLNILDQLDQLLRVQGSAIVGHFGFCPYI